MLFLFDNRQLNTLEKRLPHDFLSGRLHSSILFRSSDQRSFHEKADESTRRRDSGIAAFFSSAALAECRSIPAEAVATSECSDGGRVTGDAHDAFVAFDYSV